MSILWSMNRLRAMSAPEIGHRLAEKTRKVTARSRLEGWIRYANDGGAPALPALRRYVAAFDEKTREAIARSADDILDGRFSALGCEWPRRDPANLFPSELWRLDPVTRDLWPGAEYYCFDIAYRHERERGDVKYVWEINRLQFLHPLAAKVFLYNDARALAAIESAIASWYAGNPPFRGLCWNSGIEIALRAVSFLVVSTLAAEKLARETVAKVRAALAASLFWLARYPSRFSSANNHLIAESTGELLISLAMPDLPAAQAIRSKARSVLEEEAQKQFFGDGVPAEQSPTYGAFAAELLMLAHGCSPLNIAARARLERVADFIYSLADRKGRVPAIGDNDEGRVLAFVPSHETYAFEVARRIKAPHVPMGLSVFPDGGYSIFRDRRWHVVFDHGPLGYLSIAAHGHADALSVIVSLDGQPLLVDPGTYLYHSGGGERDWFRGTPAHNTLNIAGESQSVISGPFNWSAKAEARLEEVREEPDWRITASHDGYEKRFGIRHRRSISACQGGLLIQDRLLGDAREAEIVFQLAPGLDARVDGADCHVAIQDRALAAFSFKNRGRVSLRDGAVSPRFGMKRSAPCLIWQGRLDESGVSTIIGATNAEV